MKITGVKINKSEIDKKVLNSKTYNKEAFNKIDKKVRDAQNQLAAEFEKHPITREIDAGPGADNISDTLFGYGNLFSYIGFGSGSSPLANVRSFVKQKIKISSAGRKGNSMEFLIRSPSMKDLELRSPMPFEAGNSWVRMLELGMSNFSFYMYKQSQVSRSGTGIQIDNRIRSQASKPTPYFTKILNNFRRNLLR
jgi:hypothetical protein